jgi:peptidoglycan/xylan/chitin deacetylase (PgdA/CDA1 family)
MRILFSAVNNSVATKVLHILEQANGGHQNLLRVLTYHHIDYPSSDPTAYHRVTVTPEDFDRQIQYLAENYHVLTMAELLDAYQNGTSLPANSAMVTFDDAYEDFAEYAWPILKVHQVPVTVFVPTAFPDNPERTLWWERLHQALYRTIHKEILIHSGQIPLRNEQQRKSAFDQFRKMIKSLPHDEAMDWIEEICAQLQVSPEKNKVLGWDALRRLAQEGVTLGAHTRNHPMMDQISLKVAEEEIEGSLSDLRREIGEVLPIFAYPGGRFNREVESVLKAAGVFIAFSTTRGINDMSKPNWMRLHRIKRWSPDDNANLTSSIAILGEIFLTRKSR